MKKVLFLDMDGVLNKGGKQKVGVIEKDLVNILNNIANGDIEFILSSSWRYILEIEDINAILKNSGFISELNGVLDSEGETRGDQIKEWVRINGVEYYAILDDNGVEDNNLVRVDNKIGVSFQNIHSLKEVLQIILNDELSVNK
jgi:hypothetical protein